MDPIARHAQARPEAPVLLGPDRRWTYADLHRRVGEWQGVLRTEGIRAGTRVALHLERSSTLVGLLWALWRMGAVAVPLSTREPPETVVTQALQVGAAVCLTTDAGVTNWAPDRLPTLRPTALRKGDPSRSALAEHALERPATILYTSGSTGAPKAALHTWANHLYSAKGSNANIPLRAGDRWLLTLPLYHVGGLAILVRCALAGAAVQLAGPEGAETILQAEAATHASMVPTQFRRVLEATDGAPSPALRAVLLGGGPIPRALLREGREKGWPLHTSYGCTEMASQVTTTPPGAAFDTLRTAGRRLPHRRVRIGDDGEIFVAGRPLFKGYVTEEGLRDPRRNDWYPTGDRGRLDAQGRLHVEGRMDRMFVSGGENVQPAEIETALEQIEGVARAVVVSVPDPEFGDRPVAFVQADAEHSPDTLRAALTDLLPGFKIPDAFHSLAAADRRDDLKIDRERLREQARKLQE
ncbi:MAG: o-succinylbenzoate--CoA ligase [Bacteroidetes bacterium SW_9_63_38]|nr:MAG: o-succinylbenzoate--CoA ligase [Bacteroidetes bacterium SW_9_63_38]